MAARDLFHFVGTSAITDFHVAVGQFINYRTALKMRDPDRKLYLAVPEIAYETFFLKDFPRLVIQEYQLSLIIYDVANERSFNGFPRIQN